MIWDRSISNSEKQADANIGTDCVGINNWNFFHDYIDHALCVFVIRNRINTQVQWVELFRELAKFSAG